MAVICDNTIVDFSFLQLTARTVRPSVTLAVAIIAIIAISAAQPFRTTLNPPLAKPAVTTISDMMADGLARSGMAKGWMATFSGSRDALPPVEALRFRCWRLAYSNSKEAGNRMKPPAIWKVVSLILR